MKQYMEILGLKCKDKVTNYIGIATCISFDLYGCVQVALMPQVDEKGAKRDEGHWFDHKRLEVLDKTPVIPIPNFDLATADAVSAPKKTGTENGPAEKPHRSF